MGNAETGSACLDAVEDFEGKLEDEQGTEGKHGTGAENALDSTRRLEQARALLVQNPLCRSALYRILKTCAPERFLLHDLEDHIQQMPEYAGVTQPPYFLIQWLVDVGALDVFELDDQGNDITEDRKDGLTEDEIDDLVADFAYRTNEVGRTLLDEFKPTDRLADLLAMVPERYDTYVEVLDFLTEPRSYAEIDSLLRGRDILMFGRDPDDRPIQPSIFVDKLAAAGSIVYNEGWLITDEGKEFLERIREQENDCV